MTEEPLDFVQIHAGMDQASRKCVPQVMKGQVFNPGLFQRHVEAARQIPLVSHRVAGGREYQVLRFDPSALFLHQQFKDPRIQWNGPVLLVLALHDHEDPASEIHVLPFEPEDFSPPHPGIEREGDQLLQPEGRGTEQAPLFVGSEPPIARIMNRLHGDSVHRIFPAPFPFPNGHVEQMAHHPQFLVDRGRCCAVCPSFHFVLTQQFGTDLIDQFVSEAWQQVIGALPVSESASRRLCH